MLGGKHEEFCRVAENVAELLPGDKFIFCADKRGAVGRQAVKAAFRRDTPPDVLLLTAHGFVEVAEHQLSGLLLQDSLLGRVGARLQGDEPASLAESFLHLGAASVVAPLWDSEYEPPRLWIEHSFEAWLARGKPKALSSRDATRQMRRRMGDDRPERSGVLTLRGDWL